MARFCPWCGAPLAENARFCAGCGAQLNDAAAPQPEAPQGAAPQPEAPQGAAPQPETPKQEAPQQQAAAGGGAAPTPPKPKKPLPKWALPTGIAVAAVVVVLVALSRILGSVNSPESVSEKFLKAMDAGDFAALSKVAVLADEEQTLTAEAAQPFFDLYASDIAFRMQLEELLDEDEERIDDGRDPNEGYLVDLRAQSGFLHTAYKVVLETCGTVEIYADLGGTAAVPGHAPVELLNYSTEYGVLHDGDLLTATGPDAGLGGTHRGVLYDVLPGLYPVTGTVTTSTGQTFTAETELRVSDPYQAECLLRFDHVWVVLENDGALAADLFLDGTYYDTIPAYEAYFLTPVRAGTVLRVQADTGRGDPLAQSFPAEPGTQIFAFRTCTVEVQNDYRAPMYVDCGGETVLACTGVDGGTVSGLLPGETLRAQLYDGSVVEPVEMVCTDEYAAFAPEFTELTDEAADGILKAVAAHVDEVNALCNSGDADALMSFDPMTGYSVDMALSQGSRNLAAERDGTSYQFRCGDVSIDEGYRFFTIGDPLAMTEEEYRVPTLMLRFDIVLEVTMTTEQADGSQQTYSEGELTSHVLTVQRSGGSWVVVG